MVPVYAPTSWKAPMPPSKHFALKRGKRRVGESKPDGIDAEHAARAMAAGKGIVPKSHNGWVEGLRALTVARSIHVNTMTGVSNAIAPPLGVGPSAGQDQIPAAQGSEPVRKTGVLPPECGRRRRRAVVCVPEGARQDLAGAR